MSRLAVLATYDAEGRLWPHVRHQIETYAASAEVILVSAGGLRDEDRAWAQARSTVVERGNSGYDFASYKAGLDAAGDLARFDLVLLANDSFIGPVVPLAQIIEEMAARGIDFWGLTRNGEMGDHVQSYFVGFEPTAVASEAFEEFWRDFEPVDDRGEVITRYEIGLTRRLAQAGLTYDAYFVPRAHEMRRARARRSWMGVNITFDPDTDPHLLPNKLAEWTLVRNIGIQPPNPCNTMADSVLDDGRLPIAKIETLRDDPYALDAETLLWHCERAYPAVFEGVRDYLDHTRKDRGRRLTKVTPLTAERRLDGQALAYCAPAGQAVDWLRPSSRFAPGSLDGENTPPAQIAALVGSEAAAAASAPEVLDVGCWTGEIGRRLSAQGCRVTGVEADPEAAAYAGKELADVVVADPFATPLTELFAPGSFDVVVLAELMEYVADPGSLLEEARALLAPGGQIVISTPNASHGSRRLAVLQGHWSTTALPVDRTPLRSFNRQSLIHLLIDAGLVATALRGTVADPLVSDFGVPERSLPYAIAEWVRDRPEAMIETIQIAARPLAPGERPVRGPEIVPAVDPATVRLTDAHTERAALIKSERRAGRRLPERVAELEEQVRRLEAELARNPLRRAAGQLKRKIF
ncbi:MAG: rhamnan synthesis F family protein [Nocardioides sp.]|uniref:class I SAM-dependent methyltransferase n=1 Tax=Nocardioides sp. TaxID=35761 RepID=UPI003D6B13D8